MIKYINTIKINLNNYKKFLFYSLLIFITITIIQTYSSINNQLKYQEELINKVADRVSVEYQLLMSTQKSLMNEFQLKNSELLKDIYNKGASLNKEEYMNVLNKLKKESDQIRLFTIVNNEKVGLHSHIIGNFAPDCKEEVDDIYKKSSQEKLFLHKLSKGMHYDVLIPFLDKTNTYFFVSFYPEPVQNILTSYSLPYQEVFLLRNDKVGAIELSSTTEIKDNIKSIIMTDNEIKEFSYIKPIKNTRWNVALKLSKQYRNKIILENIKKSALLIVFFFIVLFLIFKLISSTNNKLNKANELIKNNQKIDPLTDFMNKYSYTSTVFEAIKNPKHTNNTILNIKLKGFENDIDNKRSEVEDYYIKYVSIKLKELLNDDYVLGRIGSVLSIYKEGITKERAMFISKEIDKILMECNYCKHQNISLQIIGIELKQKFTSAVEILNTIKELEYKNYNEKISLLTDESKEIKEIFENQKMLNLLRHSIKNESLILYKQKIKGVSKNIEQFEVLVRLKDEEDKIISPFKFIPLAEQRGDIVDLDKLVIKKTFEKLKKEEDNIHCSINLSGKTLTEIDLHIYIENLIKEYDINPKRITFEVTETYAVQHIEVATKFINWARQMGFQFALDDFGQGVSSFSYLQRLPINKLKIDGSFIKDIESNEKNKMFVKTMIELSHQMEMDCVAEFVENDSIIKILEELNVDYLQGYGIEKPNEWK
tara:strand:+ start:29986 stop:32115 length:2130 start_codon:yes stop_codon:yes gene_type:complete